MQFLKALFGNDLFFKDSSVVGLSGLRKRTEYVKLTVPESYKKTYIPKYENNFVLI